MSGGKITGITMTNKGSGYLATPNVTVVGGPHFVRLTEKGSPDVGRYFLITDNTANQLTLDVSKLATKSKTNPTGETLAKILQVDYSVEIVPAVTVGGILGNTKTKVEANGFTTGFPGHLIMFTLESHHAYMTPISFWVRLRVHMIQDGIISTMLRWSCNRSNLYPDESFIVANRTSGPIDLTIEGAVGTTNQKMYLPNFATSVDEQPFWHRCHPRRNYSADFMGTEVYDFRPSASDGNTTHADTIFFLSGTSWNEYYYKGG